MWEAYAAYRHLPNVGDTSAPCSSTVPGARSWQPTRERGGAGVAASPHAWLAASSRACEGVSAVRSGTMQLPPTFTTAIPPFMPPLRVNDAVIHSVPAGPAARPGAPPLSLTVRSLGLAPRLTLSTSDRSIVVSVSPARHSVCAVDCVKYIAPSLPAAIEVPSAVSGNASGSYSPPVVSRSTRGSELWVTHSVPSPAAAMPAGLESSGNAEGTTSPLVEIEPMPRPVVNHRRSPGPGVIGPRSAGTVVKRYGSGWTGNSLIVPAGVIRPIRAVPPSSVSVNQALPSGPAAIAPGPAPGLGVGNSVTRPSVVMRAMRLAYGSLANAVPSGRTAMPNVSPFVWYSR